MRRATDGDGQPADACASVLVVKVFPRTPHLAWSGYVGRDDLRMTEEETIDFVSRMTVVQEKLDGANVSIRIEHGRVVLENRGKPISAHEQFDRLKAWAAARPSLIDLGDRTLYGEWLFAQHGTPYEQLPDYFIAYDVWENDMFLSAKDVRAACEALGIGSSPALDLRRRRDDLLALASGRSLFGTGRREGVYCRIEEEGRCIARAKLVRPGYKPRSDEEWERHGVMRNKLR